MPLRKSPRRTSALVAAWRANARKSRGPKSFRGKARASLNALKHGEYALHLRWKLVEAGDRQGEALYVRIEARVAEAFGFSRGSSGPSERTPSARAEGVIVEGKPERSSKDERELRELTSMTWCFAVRRRPKVRPHLKTNLECALESVGCDSRDLSQDPVRVHDGRRRIGLVFWRQRRRMHRRGAHGSPDASFHQFWERFGDGFRRLAVALDQAATGQAGSGQAGSGTPGADGTDPERTGRRWTGAPPEGPWRAGAEGPGAEGLRERTEEWTGEVRFKGSIFERLAALAGLGEWESGWRSRIFRLRRPNIWARLHYGLDKDGVYSPQIEARGRRELKKLCLAGIPVSSCPSVIDERLVPDPTLIPYGFETMP